MFLQILHGKPCGSIFDKLLVHAFKTTHGSTKLLSNCCHGWQVYSQSELDESKAFFSISAGRDFLQNRLAPDLFGD